MSRWRLTTSTSRRSRATSASKVAAAGGPPPPGRRTFGLLLAPAREAPFRNAPLAAEVPNRALLRFDPFDGLALKVLVVATTEFTLFLTHGADSSLAPLSAKSTTPHRHPPICHPSRAASEVLLGTLSEGICCYISIVLAEKLFHFIRRAEMPGGPGYDAPDPDA